MNNDALTALLANLTNPAQPKGKNSDKFTELVVLDAKRNFMGYLTVKNDALPACEKALAKTKLIVEAKGSQEPVKVDYVV